MNVEQLKVMLELQALKGFNSSQSGSDTNSMFQDLLTELLSDSSLSSANSTNNQQGAVTQLQSYLNTPVSPIAGTVLPPVNLTKFSGSNKDFNEIIEKAAAHYNIPEKLLHSVIKQESNFNPNAVSYAGASGLMQLMPETARGLGVKNVFDPQENVFGGAKYLRQMLNKYDENIELALAAYNAGPGNVDKFGGIPPFKETQNYVQKIKTSFLA
ncbi:lytic transglycosylase domain-containing protein [Cytobacillus praedii]|uniref:lytic transglycosylase domain-containing protein n=1 Tax=Cytobacillus praedii TaxID=1742358 RepID=UPI00070EB056|nr:lytic transglycosylase domain-containing protein [Cytobacillus praedii]